MQNGLGVQYDSVHTGVGSHHRASQLVPTGKILQTHQGQLCPGASHHSSHRHTLLSAEAGPSIQQLSMNQHTTTHDMQTLYPVLHKLPGPFNLAWHALVVCRRMTWVESILSSSRAAMYLARATSTQGTNLLAKRRLGAIYFQLAQTRSEESSTVYSETMHP